MTGCACCICVYPGIMTSDFFLASSSIPPINSLISFIMLDISNTQYLLVSKTTCSFRERAVCNLSAASPIFFSNLFCMSVCTSSESLSILYLPVLISSEIFSKPLSKIEASFGEISFAFNNTFVCMREARMSCLANL